MDNSSNVMVVGDGRDPVGEAPVRSLKLFQAAVDCRTNLEIMGEAETDDGMVLVIKNNDISPDIEGHETTIELSELFAVVKDEKTADGFVACVNLERSPIELHGISRIVGYYSRISNWNKSKIGELRDRASGQYGTGKHVEQHSEERMAAIDSR